MLTITVMLWAGNAVAGKFAIGHISPMVLTLSRWVIALCIITIIGRHHIRSDWPIIRDNWLYFLLMGGFGFMGFNFALYLSLHYTSAINVTIEQTAMPLLIFLFNFVFYRVGIRWLQVFGYTFTVVGVVVVATYGQPWILITEGAAGVNRGDLIMLVGSLFYAAYSVALRSKPDIHWQSNLAALIAGGVIFSLFGLAYEGYADDLIWPHSWQGYAAAIYAGTLPSLVSQGFFMAGVATLGANRAGLYINLVPVFAALFAVILLGETLFTFHAIAFLLVVGGVLIAQRASKINKA